MYTGTKSNEELVELYRGTKDERYLSDLLEQNAGIIYLLAEPFVHTIPNAELEDLIQEANIALVKAVAEFDVNKGYTFTTFLKGVVRQRLSRIYNAETRKKRYRGRSMSVMRDWLKSTKRAAPRVTDILPWNVKI